MAKQFCSDMTDEQFSDKLGGASQIVNIVNTLGLLSNISTQRAERYTGDLNNIIKNSVYNVASSEVTNKPSEATSWGFVITFVHCFATTHAIQLWINMTTSAYLGIYIRGKASGIWDTTWRQIAFAS